MIRDKAPHIQALVDIQNQTRNPGFGRTASENYHSLVRRQRLLFDKLGEPALLIFIFLKKWNYIRKIEFANEKLGYGFDAVWNRRGWNVETFWIERLAGQYETENLMFSARVSFVTLRP